MADVVSGVMGDALLVFFALGHFAQLEHAWIGEMFGPKNESVRFGRERCESKPGVGRPRMRRKSHVGTSPHDGQDRIAMGRILLCTYIGFIEGNTRTLQCAVEMAANAGRHGPRGQSVPQNARNAADTEPLAVRDAEFSLGKMEPCEFVSIRDFRRITMTTRAKNVARREAFEPRCMIGQDEPEGQPGPFPTRLEERLDREVTVRCQERRRWRFSGGAFAGIAVVARPCQHVRLVVPPLVTHATRGQTAFEEPVDVFGVHAKKCGDFIGRQEMPLGTRTMCHGFRMLLIVTPDGKNFWKSW